MRARETKFRASLTATWRRVMRRCDRVFPLHPVRLAPFIPAAPGMVRPGKWTHSSPLIRFMKLISLLGLAVSQLLWLCPPAHAQAAAAPAVKFQDGPSVGALKTTASIKVPAGYVFAGAKDTKTIMESMQNTVSGAEMGFIAPKGEDWFVVFEFDETGYIKDDEKGSLDAAAMLESIKRGTEESNKTRRERGWATMTITGWEQPPKYNETTHNLEWAIRGESENKPLVNHNTRLLGRGGVMRVTLVSDPAALKTVLPQFRTLMKGYDFNAGERYAEFKAGDKVAEYGLTALVVGGATAVAAKAGLFKWVWKLLVFAGVGIAAFLKKLFGKSSQ